MIDKIIEILEDNFDDYDEIAMQEKFIKIATEIDKITYPKEFIEWTGNWQNLFDLGSWIRTDDNGNCISYTTDELYEYWQNLGKEK